jgi:hypothetical protein
MAKSDIPNMRVCGEDCIAQGELDGPDGFQAQTVNGTAHWKGTGWTKDWRGGWSPDRPWQHSEQVAPDATRPRGRSNRTGE